ncbi:hypothetical protein SPBR_05801 [Sporothrix brasiliensis 5110]|uniref:Meiotically up-regulated gene 154 protein n=1 Tax=Sporothrix brasiliensis 5110 TaxID=1398154 RepID=A0A0C2J4M7_9PEZI|nr:uncharacterized protein SPBR_05801 [Sporothrix brasiliensis 5110]KIH93975.1 hypothetical protein SPBR_05801 [Sporothrix brasiliensis 5110]
MPRLVRRQTLSQRITAAMNPWDFLLWLSEEIETRELDAVVVGSQVGVVANFLFLLARANLGSSNSADDDVFGDGSGRSWLSYLIQLLVWAGFSLSVANAVFVYTRKRHYRLFEANIDRRPGTPSASRVRVQSSPATNSPLRVLGDLVHSESAESRAHPDSTRDVWELAVWDPRPASLALLSFFSPLHVLIYLFELPLDPLEPRPSVAVLKCIVLQVGLSAAMRLLQARNDQRQRDNAIIQKEVLNEYNTKFVQPRLHPIVRDMGTQVAMDTTGVAAHGSSADGTVSEAVECGTPTTVIHRGFQTHPNANYIKHIDPDFGRRDASSTGRHSGPIAATPRHLTPAQQRPARYSDSFTPGGSTSVAAKSRQSMPVTATPSYASTGEGSSTSSIHAGADAASGVIGEGTRSRTGTAYVANSPFAPASSVRRPAGLPASATTNFGGSMGVYSHVNSPLKKAISMNDIGSSSAAGGFQSPRNSRELAAVEQRDAAERMQRMRSPTKSPRKENFQPPQPQTESRLSFQPQELSSPPVPFNPFAKTRPSSQFAKNERFPSRW